MRFMVLVKANKETKELFEPDDFGDALKPEFKEQEKRLRAKGR